MLLSDVGLTDTQRASFAELLPDGTEIARVTTVHRTNVMLETEHGAVLAELTGTLRFEADSSEDRPAVGDWVAARVLDAGSFAMVTSVLPRTSLLRRKMPGGQVRDQVIAANVHTAFILHPADRPVHHRRLERYLVMTRDGGIEPVIVLSKIDLIDPSVLEERIADSETLARTVAVSSMETDGLDGLSASLIPQKTHVLLGPSGVGKSTLLNRLVGAEVFATSEIREADGRGRHTTTRRELVVLPGGSIIIDTPGMRELGLADMGDAVGDTFADIEAIATSCRFRDCTHTTEDGCAVLDAVNEGDVEDARYRSYLKLAREAERFSLSKAELRQKGRDTGKLYKRIIKEKRDRR